MAMYTKTGLVKICKESMWSCGSGCKCLDCCLRENVFKLHVAIDFGTDGLGLAYAIEDEVYLHSKWKSAKYSNEVKPKTIILLDEDGNMNQFGKVAKEAYIRLVSNKHKWMLFERFKMSLYDTQNVNKNDDESHETQDVKDQIDIKNELIAANGKSFPSETVFVEAFKYLEKEAKKFLRKRKIKNIKKHDIQWILTVPAIWNNQAKDKMIRWITKAGLVDDQIIGQCVIVREPDCAALAVQHTVRKHIKTKNHLNDNDDMKFNGDFDKGEKYILVDAGGGTVDIACHEILDKFGFKKILTPSGGAWGSCYIDDQYKKTLGSIFGEDLMKEFEKKHPNIFIEILNNFQRAKSDFYKQEKDHYNCELPEDFIAWLEEKFEDNDDIDDVECFVNNSVMGKSNLVTLNDEMLELDNTVWISMFDHVINPIIEHIKKLLDKPEMKMNCNYLSLVGGLSCSPYFQYKMEMEFGCKSRYKLELIIPKRPILSVVEGAAYFPITYYHSGGVENYHYGSLGVEVQTRTVLCDGIVMERRAKYSCCGKDVALDLDGSMDLIFNPSGCAKRYACCKGETDSKGCTSLLASSFTFINDDEIREIHQLKLPQIKSTGQIFLKNEGLKLDQIKRRRDRIKNMLVGANKTMIMMKNSDEFKKLQKTFMRNNDNDNAYDENHYNNELLSLQQQIDDIESKIAAKECEK